MLQHISIRIPWKNNGYIGNICDKPSQNNCCLRLKNIGENRDDDYERKNAGKAFSLCDAANLPCLSEGGAFISAQEYTIERTHPYVESQPKTHGHFLPTKQTFTAFSYPAIPFAWAMKHKDGKGNYIEQLAVLYDIDYNSKPIISGQFSAVSTITFYRENHLPLPMQNTFRLLRMTTAEL